jgi:hypothetical protein
VRCICRASRWCVETVNGITLTRWAHAGITNSSASVISKNLYDVFGVLRHPQGVAQTPWRWIVVQVGDEPGTGLFNSYLWIVDRGISASYATATGFFSNWTGWLRPVVTPVCLGCLGGFAAPLLALIADCGVPNPFNMQWRECVANAVDAFKQECEKDAICRWIFKGCVSICGAAGWIGLQPKPEEPAKPVRKPYPIPRYKRLDISQY